MAKYQEQDAESYSASEFDCPNCGERVYHQLLVCPKCGLHFYPDDDEDEAASLSGQLFKGVPVASGFSFWLVLMGWVVAAGTAFLLQWVFVQIWSPRGLSTAGMVITAASAPLGAFIGGYLAAWNGKFHSRAPLYGLAVGLLSAGQAFIIEAYWHNLGSQPVTAGTAARLGAVLLAGLVGGLLCQRTQR